MKTCTGCGVLVDVVARDHAAAKCVTCDACLMVCLVCEAEGAQLHCTPCFDRTSG